MHAFLQYRQVYTVALCPISGHDNYRALYCPNPFLESLTTSPLPAVWVNHKPDALTHHGKPQPDARIHNKHHCVHKSFKP